MARTVGSNAPETRRRILDSAADAFAAHGYSGASMRDIAEGLGITKAALYYHFASKEDLLDGLVQPVMQTMADFADTAQAGGLTAAEVLSGFIELTMDSVPALFPLMVDPGARSAIKTRYDLPGLNRRIETALAGDGGAMGELRAQFVLGGIRSIVVGRLLGGMHGEEKCGPHGPHGAGRPAGGTGVFAQGQAAGSVRGGADHGPQGGAERAAQGGAQGGADHGAPGGAEGEPAGRAERGKGRMTGPPLSRAECEVLLESALAGLLAAAEKLV